MLIRREQGKREAEIKTNIVPQSNRAQQLNSLKAALMAFTQSCITMIIPSSFAFFPQRQSNAKPAKWTSVTGKGTYHSTCFWNTKKGGIFQKMEIGITNMRQGKRENDFTTQICRNVSSPGSRTSHRSIFRFQRKRCQRCMNHTRKFLGGSFKSIYERSVIPLRSLEIHRYCVLAKNHSSFIV